MGSVLYFVARLIVGALRLLPLTWVARIGRAGGTLAGIIDRKRRQLVLNNLLLAFPERAAQVPALMKENFRRIGENYCCASVTGFMSFDEVQSYFSYRNTDHIAHYFREHPKGCVIAAIGHFGNFELFARFGQGFPGIQAATTYRGFDHPGLDRLLKEMRQSSGCLFFERRREGKEMREAMQHGGIMMGFLADQHAGDRGLPLPFFGRICSTSAAPAVYALRYQSPVTVGICYRVALAKWVIEFGPFIPTHEGGQPRSVEAIMADVNQSYEAAVRRDPANWFWVHQRWKPGKHRPLRTSTRELPKANSERRSFSEESNPASQTHRSLDKEGT